MVMTGDMAVVSVLKRINSVNIPTTGENASIAVFKYDKAERFHGEYIAINHLPFVCENVIEHGIVNVNVHVPKLNTNEADTKRLGVLCNIIRDLFPADTYINGAYYSYYCDSRPTLDNDETYYINLKIRVEYSNLDFNRIEN